MPGTNELFIGKAESVNADEEYIGADGTILPGVTVGNNVVVAAGVISHLKC